MTTSRSNAMGLRAYQMKARQDIHKGFETFDRQFGVLPTGCHAPGHPILMADGSLRPVESICVGDQVMGPDSLPRTVLHLHTGTDGMFRVTPIKGEPFIVNGGHIFSLARTRTGKPSEDKQPWIREISVREWIDSNRTFRHLHKLRRVAVEFPDRGSAMRRIDPYMLGVLLGDGSLHHGNVSVCTPDPEIVREIQLYAQKVGSRIRVEPIPGNKATNYFFKGREIGYANEFVRDSIRAMGLAVPCGEKHVPECYKTAPIRTRIEILAGLLDTDGHLSRAGYEFCSKSPRLADDVTFIARSLGFAAYQSVKIVNGVEYRRISISGDCSWLPLRIVRKRAPERNQIKDVLVTGFKVEPVGDGIYHGFTLDGDHLYLDGSFTVHHNSGKTILFSRLADDIQPQRTLILAHREELITQAVDKLRSSTGIQAQVEMGGDRASLDAPVVVASVQTLMREPRRNRWPRDHFGLVVVDECFPAGTLVDGRAIESISEGELVRAFDHASNKLELRKVTRVFQRETDRICRILLSDGRLDVCTPCHPFWNGSAYIPADQLTPQSVVYGITENHVGPMQTLRRHGGVSGAETESPEPQRDPGERGVLLAGMQGCPASGDQLPNRSQDQSQICVAADADQKPDARSGVESQDAGDAQGDGLDAAGPRGQRQTSANGADAAGVGSGLGNGSGGADEATSGQRLPDLLQTGHGESGASIRCGSGRAEPLFAGETGAGSQEGGIAPIARVEGIAFFERGCDPEFELLCPGGVVFNLEVGEHHNYFVDGILVHNCHHVLADSYLNTLGHFHDHAKVLGVTATPDRGDKKNLGKYFENIACEVSLLDLVKQGWLSPIKVKTVPLELNLRGVRTSHGDFSADDLGHALEPYLEKIADVLVEHRDRKTLVFLPLIAVSKRFAEICRDRGLLAEHVDGQSRERQAVLERFKRDETRILTNAMLLTEGYDEPSIDCVVCLRPTKIRALYSQIIGRGTRIWPGKDHLLVLDFLWQSEEHSLVKPAHLIAEDEEDAKALTEKLGREGDLEEAREEVNADRTRSLTERLSQNRMRNGSVLDPLELAVTLNEAALAEYVPTMAWQAQAPTDRQLDVLHKFGLDTMGILSKGHASMILDRLITRRQLGLATPKQVRVMRRYGHQRPETATFEEAKAFLDARFANR